jgi:hypothetical protein
MSKIRRLMSAVSIAACIAGTATAAPSDGIASRPMTAGQSTILTNDQCVRAADGMPGWVVQLRDVPANGAALETRARRTIDQVVSQSNGEISVRDRYDHALIGFSAFMSDETARALSRHPLVVRVEPDFIVHGAIGDGPIDPDSPDSWGLRRISSPDGLAPTFDPCDGDGSGVNVIIVDSGITPAQTEFTGRIRNMVNFYPDDDTAGDDSNGHGTRTASIAAGSISGVARNAEITSLRVLGPQNSGSVANIVSGLNWIANPANVGTPAVVNMSLATNWYGSQMYVWNIAINTVLQRGIPIFAAAGNSSLPSYMNYPAAKPGVCAVGATDVNDLAGIYSNFGPVVGIWAPGSLISSADWKHPDGGLMLRTGTSAAAPFATGVAAQFLQRFITDDDYDAPKMVVERTYLSLMQSAVEGRLESNQSTKYGSPYANGTLGGAANRLLQVCPEQTGVVCDDTLVWYGNSASIVLGDGITAATPGTSCSRTIWNASGPVQVMFNAVAIGQAANGSALAELTVTDRATGNVIWSAANAMGSGYGSVYKDLTATSSSNLGLQIDWTSSASATDPVGYGYAATALVVGDCPGDIDGSGMVDGLDLTQLLGAWGPCNPTTPCLEDLDMNGFVDGADLTILLSYWGTCPTWTEPGYVRDCNGTPVLGGLIGDDVLDDGTRLFVADPADTDVQTTSVNLDCAALNWDTVDDRYVISPSDPRTGACATPDGDCSLMTFADCTTADGVFWGRGIACSDAGDVLELADVTCPDGAIATGYPPAENLSFEIAISGVAIGTVFRQQMPEGITSISRLRFLAAPRPLGYGKTNVSSSTPGRHGLALGTTPYRIIVGFTDGGPDLVLDTQPRVDATLQSDGPVNFELCTVDDLLPPQDREVKTIGIRMVPRGPYIVSTECTLLLAGGFDFTGAADQPAETSPDGGTTWYPIESSSATGQFSICVEP